MEGFKLGGVGHRPLARAGGPGPRQAAGGVMPGLGTCLGAPLRIPGL